MNYKRTAWEVLGVSPMATDDEVIRAFKNQSEKFNPKYYPKYKGNEIYCSKMESVFKLINEAFNALGGWETIKEDRERYNRLLDDEDMARDQLNIPESKEVGLDGIIQWFTFTGAYSIEGVEGNLKPEDFEGVKRSILDGLIIGTGAGFEGVQRDYEPKSLTPHTYSQPNNHNLGFKKIINEFIRHLTPSSRRARERRRNKGFENDMKRFREEKDIREMARHKPQGYGIGGVVNIDNYRQERDERQEITRKTGIEDQRQVENWKKGINGDMGSETSMVSPINKITMPAKGTGFESGITREYRSGAEGRRG